MAMEKTFDAAEAEKRIYQAWVDAGAFKAGANAKPDAPTFSIMIPPPNVTGALHVGHAFNNTLQDILIRWHRMQGHDTLWQPGTDHAGIATQLQVEKMLAAEGGETRAEMGREAFIAKTWEWKEKYGATIINQLKRLGASCDWDRTAFTMSGAPGAPKTVEGNFHDAVLKVFVDLYNKGLIYRGKRLVNWDPHFETAISDLEVENIEVDGHMWHFKYPLAGNAEYEYVEKDESGNVTLREMRNYISIATTRPETMLGDGAVAVHPDDERYAPIVGKLCEIPVGPKQHRRLIPIIVDTYPVMDFGSGAVKITGAHDLNDYGVAKRNNIPMYRLMDTKAQMRTDGAPYAETAARAQKIAEGADWTDAEIDTLNLVPDAYRGLDRFEARKAVVADITAEGLAVTIPNPRRVGGSAANAEGSPTDAPNEPAMIPFVESKKIMQPFCDRSRVVMEPMLTDQWYVDAEKLAGPARDAVRDGRVKIMPESGEKVYFHWMQNIEPWCISRQLWWGHQIPVWYGPKIVPIERSLTIRQAYPNLPPHPLIYDPSNLEIFCASSEEEAVRKAKNYYSHPVQAFETGDSARAEYEKKFGFEAMDSTDFVAGPDAIPIFRDPDVLDTWFSSGLWPIGTLGWPNWTEDTQKYFPTSTLITGQDILFFWVARMMMMQLEVTGKIPFDTVYLHQLVRDERGVKMSKTLGNVIDPLDMIDEFGADAVRFTMTSMAAIGGSLKLSTERVKGYRNFGTKLWNAARFAEMNGVFERTNGTNAVTTPRTKRTNTVPQPTETLNKWIIGEVAKTRESVDAALLAYRFNDAANTLYSFVWGTFCDWYIEFSKPLLYGDDQAILAETRATMGWALDQCLIMLHPIMPFITEELWTETGTHDKPLIHTDWPTYQAADMVDKTAESEMNWVISLIDAIRSARSEMRVPASLKIPMLQIELDKPGQTAWKNNQALIKRIAGIDNLTPANEVPKGAITVPVQGGTFALPLADIIDISAEKMRLQKSIDKLAKEIGALSGRLNNPKFTASAPEKVVAETRENLAIRSDEAEKIKAAIRRLEDLT